MLTELIELGRKMKEEMKSTQSEIRQNIQGTNSEGKETRTQVNNLEQKEEINIQPEQNEETRIQTNEERLRNLRNNFKCSDIWIIGVPEGEEQERETENLFEQIMKENFPIWWRKWTCKSRNLRVPKKLNPRRNTPRHIIIRLPKVKDKERILKAAREKETAT